MSMTAEALAEKAQQLADSFGARRTFEEARAALNEAGMLRARQRLADALVSIETAQTSLRAAQELASIRKSQLDQAVAEVEWELDSRFVSEGNKTFLLTLVGGTSTGEKEYDRKPMTADQRKEWKRLEALKNEHVRDQAALAAGADSEVAFCRDALALSEKAFSAARHDLDAAIATVQILAASLRKETN